MSNPVQLEIEGLFHLQGLFDIITDEVVIFDADHTVALSIEEQLHRMIPHPARNNAVRTVGLPPRCT